MAIEHMVPIEKPRRFDTKAFHGRYVPRLESYTNVIRTTALKIGIRYGVGRGVFSAEKRTAGSDRGKMESEKSTLLKTLVGEIPALEEPFEWPERGMGFF